MRKILFVAFNGLAVILFNLNYLSLQANEKTDDSTNHQLTFRAKKTDLWIKNSSLVEEKKDDDFIEVELPGELYESPKQVLEITKKEINRNTLEGIVASVFSANKAADLKWIVDNFVDEEKAKTKSLFKNKQILKESQADAQGIRGRYIKGQVEYKDYIIVFIEEDYPRGKKVTEALTCKKTREGWKVTNALASDETYDVVFAALATGDVLAK